MDFDRNKLRDMLQGPRRRMTQQALAKKLGCNPHTIGRWLSGQYRPRRSQVLAIADVLGIDAAELYQQNGLTPDEAEVLDCFRRASKADQLRIRALSLELGGELSSGAELPPPSQPAARREAIEKGIAAEVEKRREQRRPNRRDHRQTG